MDPQNLQNPASPEESGASHVPDSGTGDPTVGHAGQPEGMPQQPQSMQGPEDPQGDPPNYEELYKQTLQESQQMREAWKNMQMQAAQQQQMAALQQAQQRWYQQQAEMAQRAQHAINEGYDPQQVIGTIQQYYNNEINRITGMAQTIVQSQAAQQYAGRLAQEYGLTQEDHQMLMGYPPQQMDNMARHLAKANRDREELRKQIQNTQTRQMADQMQRSGAHRLGGANASLPVADVPDGIQKGSRDHLAFLLGMRK